MEQKAQHELKYFIAHFGEKYAREHPVDGGCYPVPSWNEASQVISKGDLMLLCCWGGHKGLFGGDVWGIGEVTNKKQQMKRTVICYDSKPLPEAVVRATIDACLTEGERRNFKMGPARGWAFLSEIQPTSFRCIVGCRKKDKDGPDYKFTVVE